MNISAQVNPKKVVEAASPAAPQTRIVDYAGRKLVSILGREKFSGERVVRWPLKVVESAGRQPVISALLPSRLGFFPCAQGQKVSRPGGDWSYTLLFCLEGSGWVDFYKHRLQVGKGSFTLLRPFEFHAYGADEKDPWSIYWIHFNGGMAPDYYTLLMGNGVSTSRSVDLTVELIQSFERMITLCSRGHSFNQLAAASAGLHQLLVTLFAAISHVSPQRETTRSKIFRTVKVMKENPDSNITIREFAAVAQMSGMYFTTQFRFYLGDSPRNYFTKIKMNKARELLAGTALKVEEVAQQVGYDDGFYFGRVFRRVTGKTPTEYRRLTAAKNPA